MDAVSTWILGGLATLIALRVFASAPSGDGVAALPSADGSVSGSSYIPTTSANARAVSAARMLAGRNLSGAKPGAPPSVWNPNAGAPPLAPAGHIVVGGPSTSYYIPGLQAPSLPAAPSSPAAASSSVIAPSVGQFTTQPLPVDAAPIIFSDTVIASPLVDATPVPVDTTPADTQGPADRFV